MRFNLTADVVVCGLYQRRIGLCGPYDFEAVGVKFQQFSFKISTYSLKMTLNPTKYMIKDLVNKPTPIEVWLQGTIEQTVGTDILIVADSSGRAKITRLDSADGVIDKNSLRKGTIYNNYYCNHHLLL